MNISTKVHHFFHLCIALLLTSTALMAQEQIPVLPDTIKPPETIEYACIAKAQTFPQLEICRAEMENLREHNEEYNKRIKRFCDSLLRFDGKLRKKASLGKLSWDDYEDLKHEINTTLNECNEKKGDHYAPYRARIREYKKGMNLIDVKKKAIIDQIGY